MLYDTRKTQLKTQLKRVKHPSIKCQSMPFHFGMELSPEDLAEGACVLGLHGPRTNCVNCLFLKQRIEEIGDEDTVRELLSKAGLLAPDESGTVRARAIHGYLTQGGIKLKKGLVEKVHRESTEWPITSDPAPHFPEPETSDLSDVTEAFLILGFKEEEVGSNDAIGRLETMYRQACLKWHPDRNPSPEAAAMFDKIVNAKKTIVEYYSHVPCYSTFDLLQAFVMDMQHVSRILAPGILSLRREPARVLYLSFLMTVGGPYWLLDAIGKAPGGVFVQDGWKAPSGWMWIRNFTARVADVRFAATDADLHPRYGKALTEATLRCLQADAYAPGGWISGFFQLFPFLADKEARKDTCEWAALTSTLGLERNTPLLDLYAEAYLSASEKQKESWPASEATKTTGKKRKAKVAERKAKFAKLLNGEHPYFFQLTDVGSGAEGTGADPDGGMCVSSHILEYLDEDRRSGITGETAPVAGPSGEKRPRTPGEGPSGAGPSGEGPSGAGPSGAGPSGAGPSGAGPSGAGPSGETAQRKRTRI